MNQLRLFLLCALLALVVPARWSYAQVAKCDAIQSCVWNAITTTATAGKAAQYTDVDTSYQIRNIDTAITFEIWAKPKLQAGKRVYIGGIWGPNKDNNDSWVAFIEDNKITFELSADNSFLGEADNTIATAVVPDLYTRGWVHLGFIWDAVMQTARIYVDGILLGQARNAQYPIFRLHHQESNKLPLQIGSANSLYDDTVRNRSFLGQIDEVMLWSRALSDQQIRCKRDKSLEGNEPNLELYYRCNDSSYVLDLCDATNHGHIGRLRSGARMYPSDRRVPVTFSISPTVINANLICQTDTDFTFTLLDTSFCGNSIYMFVYYGYSGFYTFNQSSFNLQQNVPQQFTLHFSSNLTGALGTYLYVVNQNRCGEYLQIPINLNRSTELNYNKTTIQVDTLFVGCTEVTSSEDTLTICNQSTRPVTITDAQLKNPKFSWRTSGGFQKPPLILPPGACWKVIVKMIQGDTTRTEFDTLHIISDDKCPGSGYIPVQGRSQDVFVLLYPSAKAQIKSMAFEAVCPGQISNVQDYQFRSLVGQNIYIDTMIFTNPAFFGKRFAFPILLKPKTAYQVEFIRFRPPSPGPFVGQMQVICHYRGCTIVRTIDFTGTGISVDVKFNSAVVGFGNVTIGKTSQLSPTVTNTGKDGRSMSSYLKVGDVFTIVAGASFGLAPNQTAAVTLQFRPRQAITYYDTLCVFDKQCFGTICIPVSGTGVFDQLEFSPAYLNIQNVTGCECRTDSITVKNLTAASINITGDVLNDPSGKFTLLNRAPVGNLAPGQSFVYRVRYCPNDLVNDRADRSYVAVNIAGGTKYEILLQGTSTTPKLAVTSLTTYGPVEVGWQKDDSIAVENISGIPVHVTSVAVPPGYTLLSTIPALPIWLKPRDSIIAYIQFKPTAQVAYNGNVVATLDTPCGKSVSGLLTGVGRIIKLDVPVTYINYGLRRPCECIEREIPLPNYSNFIPMSIDSIWIEAAGLPNPNSSVFQWFSRQTTDSTTPYIVKPLGTDTLVIRFCPNVPSIPSNLIMNATIHIKASTPAWKQTFTVGLSGRRELNFTPNRTVGQFPATRVDTSAQPIRIRIRVPDAFTNPSGDSVVFTNAYFVPDQRVFTVDECANKLLPWTVKRGDTLCLNINFRPRAPKKYEARLYLETSFPCHGYDTTVFVSGEGFAPAYGMQVAFDTSKIGQDTLHITTCDTLVIPIMITRDIPQNIIDMLFRIGYDTSKLKLLDITSPYTKLASVSDTGDGARSVLKDARNVKAGEVAYVRFIPKGDTARFPITLDQVDFDSDSLVFFKIITGLDRAFVIIDDPKIQIQKLVNFDTVKIKDCKNLTLVVRNPGLVPIRFDSLGTLPRFHSIVGTDKPYPLQLLPGDSIVFTIRFCPRAEGWIDTTVLGYSNFPCPINDTTHILSYGWAPPYPFTMALDPNIGVVDTVRGTIADTVEVPILMDRDMPQTPIDVRYSLSYNRRALEYLSSSSSYVKPVVTTNSFGIKVEMLGCDSIKKGEITRLRFILAVPDSVVSPMYLTPGVFTSDSIFFIKPIPTGDTSAVKVGPRCNITYLEFKGGQNTFTMLRPNPTTGRIETDFEFVGDLAPKLMIYTSTGSRAMIVLDGSNVLKSGKYHLDLDLSPLSDGAYVITFEAGRYRATQKVVLRR